MVFAGVGEAKSLGGSPKELTKEMLSQEESGAPLAEDNLKKGPCGSREPLEKAHPQMEEGIPLLQRLELLAQTLQTTCLRKSGPSCQFQNPTSGRLGTFPTPLSVWNAWERKILDCILDLFF